MALLDCQVDRAPGEPIRADKARGRSIENRVHCQQPATCIRATAPKDRTMGDLIKSVEATVPTKQCNPCGAKASWRDFHSWADALPVAPKDCTLDLSESSLERQDFAGVPRPKLGPTRITLHPQCTSDDRDRSPSANGIALEIALPPDRALESWQNTAAPLSFPFCPETVRSWLYSQPNRSSPPGNSLRAMVALRRFRPGMASRWFSLEPVKSGKKESSLVKTRPSALTSPFSRSISQRRCRLRWRGNLPYQIHLLFAALGQIEEFIVHHAVFLKINDGSVPEGDLVGTEQRR